MTDDSGTSTRAKPTLDGGFRREAPLRLFVAVDPPAATAETMAGLLKGVRLPRHRPTPPEQLHMTLLFLGEQPLEQLEEIVAAVRAAARGAGRIWVRPEGLMLLPPREARLIALRCHGDARIHDLHERLERALGRWAGTHGRPKLLPHFTLARFARGERVHGRLRLPTVEVPGFSAQEIVLVRSALGPGGATHTPMERFVLGESHGGAGPAQ